MAYERAPVCLLSRRVCYQVLRANRSWGGERGGVKRSSALWNDIFSGGSAASTSPFPDPEGTPSSPLVTAARRSLSPHPARAPIDTHRRSATTAAAAAARTQAEWLQHGNDGKSHERCQRHSDSKKHPLKIHPGRIASHFKYSPTHHSAPEDLRRLITVVVTYCFTCSGRK